jgi:hypothetical protein
MFFYELFNLLQRFILTTTLPDILEEDELVYMFCDKV